MESVLEGLEVDVHSARSAADGLAILKRCRMDVLFVDLELQESDGIRVAKEANLIQPRIPTVIVSGRPSVDSLVAALRNSFCDYVIKPVTREKVRAALARAGTYASFHRDIRPAQSGNGEAAGPKSACEIVASSRAMSQVLAMAKQAADTDVPVLIQGEKGVGKALVAREIHRLSNRAKAPFAHVLCKGLREDQLEAVLSSPAGAGNGSPEEGAHNSGLLRPDKGSLFLEDVSDLPFWAQVRLLDVLECRDGAMTPDARVIASAACDMEAAVRAGQCCQQLYLHLHVLSIYIPPLRRRREDIRPLAEDLLDRFKRQLGPSAAQTAFRFSDDAWDLLTRYDWPGNADELANVLKRAVVLTDAPHVEADVVEPLLRPNRLAATNGETVTVPLEGDLRKIQREIVREVIGRCSGNKAAAARSLGLHRKTIYRLLEEDESPARGTAASVPDATTSP